MDAVRDDTIQLQPHQPHALGAPKPRRFLTELEATTQVVRCRWNHVGGDQSTRRFVAHGALECRHVHCTLDITLHTDHNVFQPASCVCVSARGSRVIVAGESVATQASVTRVAAVVETVWHALLAEWSPAFTLAACFLTLEMKLNDLAWIKPRSPPLDLAPSPHGLLCVDASLRAWMHQETQAAELSLPDKRARAPRSLASANDHVHVPRWRPRWRARDGARSRADTASSWR